MILLYIYLIGIPITAFLFHLIPNPVPKYDWFDHIGIPIIAGMLWPLWAIFLAFFFTLFAMLGL